MKKDFKILFILGIAIAYGIGRLIAGYFGYSSIVSYLFSVEIGGVDFWIMIAPMLFTWGGFVMLSDNDIKSDYGNAQWAKTRHIKKMELFAEKGLIFGLWDKKFIRTNKPLSALIAAPPGTGKTAMVAVPNLLSCSFSMIINDTKNELWELTHKHRAKFQKVIRFAPAEEHSAKWNPLGDIPREFHKQVIFLNRIASVLYPTTGNPDKDHWPRNARTLFTFFAVLNLLENDNKTSLGKIRSQLLSVGDIQEYAAECADDFESNDDYLQKFIQENSNNIIQFDAKEFGSISSTTKTALDVFSDPFIEKNTSSSDFNIQELRDSKLSIYLCTNTEDFERVQPITRLFIELVTNKFLADKPEDGQEIVILADEFVRMGKLKSLMSAPALSRAQKVIALFIVQDFAQLKEMYGENGINELMTTTAYKLIFTQNNADAMKRVSDIIGKKTVERESISKRSDWKSNSRDKSISKEGVPLILPQEIGVLTDDQVIIIAQGYNTTPIMAKTCKWFEHPQMKKLI